MASYIGRRKFLATLLGGAATWPLAARAQQSAMPVIGFLNGQSPENFTHLVEAFRQGLKQTGYEEGRNVAIEYRWAEGQVDRLPALSADLVRRQVAVIAATGGGATPFAAKAATTTIPIVFNSAGDPVRLGLVASLNQPGGNLTGIGWFSAELAAKRLALLKELVPTAAAVALLVGDDPESGWQPADAQEAARALGSRLIVLHVSTTSEIDAAFATLVKEGAGGLATTSGGFVLNRRDQIIALAARRALPAIYPTREFAVAGGLMSYGNNLLDAYRRNGVYVGRILKGDKPGDLPIDRSTKFELVINLKTANKLGLDLPLSLQIRVDEVIE